MSNRQGFTLTIIELFSRACEKIMKESSVEKRSVKCLTSSVHRHQEKPKRSGI